ncbi:hypothetical protein CPC16_005810 [Podila verticillata]|nr:hypothetical protein CPC16_005810 [Podila verticillata]
MSETINGVLNDSSLVFYRVNEHIHKKVPILVQEKKALANIRKNVETANQDMEDARQTISSMQRIAELGRIEELVNRSLAQFEELRKVGTKLSRAAEIELQKKQQQLEYEATQRKKEDEQARKRKEAETQKLLRMELERKKMEEEHRKREVAAQLRAKERAREREREQLEREKAIERARKQKLNNPNAPTYSGSSSSRSSNKPTYSGSASGSRSTSSYMDPKASPVPRKQEFSFDFLQKVAAGGPKANGSDDRGRSDRGDRGSGTSISSSSSRMAAVERLKVNRGFSPERPISNAQALTGSKIMKRPPVKRGTGPRSPFPAFKSPGAAVNPIREAGLKAIRDGPIALNTKKRDLRSIEEITADLNSQSFDARKEERARRMRAIEDEREKQRLQREKALQAAKFSRSLMGDNADETDRLRKEIEHGENGKGSSRRGRSLSYSRSPSPRRKKSKSPIRRRSKSPPTTKRRSYSPDPRKRSISPPPRKRRSPSPPIKKKVNRDDDRDRDRDRVRDRDRERERERERERDRDRAMGSKQAIKRPGYGGSKRQVSRSPSPPRKKRAGSPRGNGRKRGPFEEDLSVSSVIGALFGTRYRAKAEDEDLSDDMEARPDEVFREEARSARIARKEDEQEAELERQQAERARKRKLERERRS